MFIKKRIQILTTLLLLSFPNLIFASGFQLYEENVTNLGNAYAGMGAEANDASTEFFNPAGMIRMETGQVVGSVTDIDIDIDAHLENATSTLLINGAPFSTSTITGAHNVQAGANAPIPSFHFVYPFCHKWAIGFGANSPFGLQTDYPDDSIGRFLATESKLTAINIGPSLAYAINRNFSIGAGVDSQYIDISLKQMVPSLLGGDEGFFHNDADNWGWGWRVGALYQYDANNRVGLTYHSRVHHTLTGDAALNLDIGALGISTVDFPGHLSADLTLPDYFDLSGYHAINCQWAWLASVDYVHWSTVQVLTANYSGTIATTPDFRLNSASIPLKFDDTWRLSTGLDYKPFEKLTLRGGVAYDPTPVPNAEFRTLRLPDGNRFWVALGGQYIINRAFTVDAGYSHLFVRHTETNNTQQFNATASIPILGQRTLTLLESATGSFNSCVNEVGAQLTWNLQSV